ncbi:MAG: alternative ribosome rescue aminoacyl-tRNA hydrolase ArfB [Myxococcota bacterium]|nr:alternative ribosome rescue aminoacyl-tRNA hydrolase ArfB [Myxococcota bacterium]
MPQDIEVNRNIRIPYGEIQFEASRSSGPGGQGVNKTNSRVTLRWNVNTSTALTESQRSRLRRQLSARMDKEGHIILHAQSERSQFANREDACRRLASLGANALHIQKKRRPTGPSKGERERRLKAKKKRGSLKASRRFRPDDH